MARYRLNTTKYVLKWPKKHQKVPKINKITLYRYLTKQVIKFINALPCISKLSAAVRLQNFTLISHLDNILTSPLERNRPTNTGTQDVLTYITSIYITKNRASVMLSLKLSKVWLYK